MTEISLEHLGAEGFGDAEILGSLQDALAAVEQELAYEFPVCYKQLLLHYRRAIFFKKGVVYVPEQASPFDDSDGFQDVELLYGLAAGDEGLLYRYEQFQHQLPERVITIGEASFGNQVCVVRAGPELGQVFFWYHEGESGENLYRIAKSLREFLLMLQPEPEKPLDYYDDWFEEEGQ